MKQRRNRAPLPRKISADTREKNLAAAMERIPPPPAKIHLLGYDGTVYTCRDCKKEFPSVMASARVPCDS